MKKTILIISVVAGSLAMISGAIAFIFKKKNLTLKTHKLNFNK